MVRCSRCKEYKDETEFNKDKNRYNGFTSYCKPCSQSYDRDLYLKQRDHRMSYAKERRAWNKKVAFDAYGGEICACCGYKGLAFLTIDHVDNDGKEHRKKLNIKCGNHFYVWLRLNNFPAGFQVLCFSCNTAKYHNGGICPHKENNA